MARWFAPQCNIDGRGRTIRMRIGFGLLAIGALLAAVAWQLQSTIAWSAAALSIAGGLFSLLEAKLGWCAARAAGFRVPY